jgi:hypothetical protein
LQGIGLTASHKQIIYDGVANEQEQTFSGDPSISIGSTIPDSLTLNAVPIAVKEQIGLLKDFKFVKLAGDNILIVDPATRKIMDIVTKQEAGRTLTQTGKCKCCGDVHFMLFAKTFPPAVSRAGMKIAMPSHRQSSLRRTLRVAILKKAWTTSHQPALG